MSDISRMWGYTRWMQTLTQDDDRVLTALQGCEAAPARIGASLSSGTRTPATAPTICP